MILWLMRVEREVGGVRLGGDEGAGWCLVAWSIGLIDGWTDRVLGTAFSLRIACVCTDETFFW
jgi:hypothetical protein